MQQPSSSQSVMFFFDQILVAGFMFSDKREWKDYVIPEIKRVIGEYQESIELIDLGFPIDWEDKLYSI